MRESKIFFRVPLYIIIFSIFCMHIWSVEAAEMLTPESFTKHVTLQPAITKVIEEDDIEAALKILNLLHGQMAEEGWVLFNIIEFIDDEDFEGFFVTYVRKKE